VPDWEAGCWPWGFVPGWDWDLDPVWEPVCCTACCWGFAAVWAAAGDGDLAAPAWAGDL